MPLGATLIEGDNIWGILDPRQIFSLYDIDHSDYINCLWLALVLISQYPAHISC